MARYDLRDKLDTQAQRTIQACAKLLLGANKTANKPNHCAPTVLAGVRHGMPWLHSIGRRSNP